MELVTFAALFIGYAFARRADVELFNQSQLLLDQRSGFINTLILITSSYFLVSAIEVIKTIETKKASLLSSKWILASIGLVSTFIKSQLVSEYFINLKKVTLKYRIIPTVWLFIIFSFISIAYYTPISN